MMKLILPCLLLFLICTACGSNDRQDALQKKETELAQKEQQLSLREKEVDLQEQQLILLKQKMDSDKAKRDTVIAQVFNQYLIGSWNVRMTCTATTCAGSAVGDVKTETWNISYDNSIVVAKANVSNQLVRTYTGNYDGAYLTLNEAVTNVPSEPDTRMNIRLTLTDSVTMEGEREIVRENDCRIVYSLQLSKQQPSNK